jgi:hypothetical protein
VDPTGLPRPMTQRLQPTKTRLCREGRNGRPHPRQLGPQCCIATQAPISRGLAREPSAPVDSTQYQLGRVEYLVVQVRFRRYWAMVVPSAGRRRMMTSPSPGIQLWDTRRWDRAFATLVGVAFFLCLPVGVRQQQLCRVEGYLRRRGDRRTLFRSDRPVGTGPTSTSRSRNSAKNLEQEDNRGKMAYRCVCEC